MIPFEPQPEVLPSRLASPFAGGAPDGLARRAAELLQAQLGGFGLERDGKMFGVLVVRARDGRVGWLKAYSGMLGGRWQVDGFAPPLFDATQLEGFWPRGEAALAALEAEHGEAVAAVGRAVAVRAAQKAEVEAMQAVHRERRRVRAEKRKALADSAALDQESRGDTAERRRLDEKHAEEGAETAPVHPERSRGMSRQAAPEAWRADVESRRAAKSNALLQQMHALYMVRNFRGEQRSLRSLFTPHAPPGGAGDCAAPRLFAEAQREHLEPLALAEFWWGASPTSGDRRSGIYYPACRGKCGAVLPFMLEGLEVDLAPLFGAASAAIPQPRVVFEDEWLVVIDKPAGLLSVPGRHAKLRDSVLSRLGEAFLSVHRLDLDTSGLMVVAKDAETHAALQRQFALRQIDKRYIALLDGDVRGDAGTIDLALRSDPEDRPRQICDPVHGKAAVTEWRVIDRRDGKTRVAFTPRTGRTHQLRVHAAVGLDAPIVGDRLYGTPAERLMLHAAALVFTHPTTHARLALESPVLF